jgi:hypothetical protein
MPAPTEVTLDTLKRKRRDPRAVSEVPDQQAHTCFKIALKFSGLRGAAKHLPDKLVFESVDHIL